MKSKEEYKKAIALISNLADALAEIECKTQEEVKEDLRKEGVDPDAAMGRFTKFLKKCSMDAKRKQLDLAAEARMKFDAKNKQDTNRKIGLSKEEMLSRIRSLMAVPEAAISASFRDLEIKEPEDIEAILEDIETSIQRKRDDEESSSK
jgi:hypothetical protein